MKRLCRVLTPLCLPAWLALATSASAASLEVLFAQTTVVPAGEEYDDAVVRNGGVLILDGGTIGTNATPSVLVEPGGHFVFNAGLIRYFENHGITELFGGRQSNDSSENRGYLRIAGGDPGIQIVHLDGAIDIHACATNRTIWEIDSPTTSASPVIRFYSVSNSLPAGSYTYATLVPATPNPFGKVYSDYARFWPNTQAVIRVDVNLASNWTGTVWSHIVAEPKPPELRTRPAIEVSWRSQTGHTYQVQFTTNLLSTNWHNLGLPVYARTTNSFILDTTPETNKSYRLLIRQ
jgi:hypothetical protein